MATKEHAGIGKLATVTDKKKIKWAGVERLADEITVIAAHNWHRSLVEIRERIEHEQRRALKPLLDKAETIINIYAGWGTPLLQFEALRKEIDLWRKR